MDDAKLMEFLLQKSETATSPIPLLVLFTEFRKLHRIGSKVGTLCTRFRQDYGSKIWESESLTDEQKVKVHFITSSPLTVDFAEKIRKSGELELDHNRRIVKYAAFDNSLKLGKNDTDEESEDETLSSDVITMKRRRSDPTSSAPDRVLRARKPMRWMEEYPVEDGDDFVYFKGNRNRKRKKKREEVDSDDVEIPTLKPMILDDVDPSAPEFDQNPKIEEDPKNDNSEFMDLEDPEDEEDEEEPEKIDPVTPPNTPVDSEDEEDGATKHDFLMHLKKFISESPDFLDLNQKIDETIQGLGDSREVIPSKKLKEVMEAAIAMVMSFDDN